MGLKIEQIGKKNKKQIYSSIFVMILILNLCSIVILSLFNYYVFHKLSDKAYLTSFLKYNKNVTEIAFNNIDKQIIQVMLHIPQLYFSDIRENEPLRLAQEEELSGYPDKVRALTTEMKKIQKTYPYISNIDIYYKGTNTVITGFDKVHFNPDAVRVNQYLPWYEGYLTNEKKEGFFMFSEGIYLKNEPVITYIKNISMPKWGENNIIIAISISPQSFTEYIEQTEGSFSILTKERELLYDSMGQEIGQNKLDSYESDSLKADDATQTNSGYFTYPSSLGDMTVFHSTSSVTGLSYLYSVNTARFYEDYKSTSKMFLINFFISIAFNLIVLLVISYYNHMTYHKKVVMFSKKAGIKLESSSKSFEGSLSALTDKITDLHEEVQSSRGMVLQNIVRSIILNQKSEDAIQELRGYFNGNEVCTFIIELSESEIERYDIEQLQAQFQPGEKSYDALFTTLEENSIIVILIYESHKFTEIERDFIDKFYEFWKVFPIVSGEGFPIDEDAIKKSYQSTMEVRRYRYLMPREIYIDHKMIRQKERKESGSHLKLFEAVRKDINNEDLLELKLHLEMIIESFKSGNYGIEYCMSTLRDLISLFYQIMQQNQLDMWVVFGYDIREYYKKLANIEMFQDWCDKLCEMILKNIHQKKMAVDVDIKARIMYLIDQNLENNISLDFLAEQIHMRPDAASRTFRQMMGMGYSEYIKARKLDRALQLMDQGYSIKNVAEILGYSTSQYFIKVFKENYGVTPYQYKKKQDQESQGDSK